MAVVLNKPKLDEQKQQQDQQAAQTPMAAGPASSGIGQQIQPQNQQQGQQFTNIRQFLGANKQAGSQLAGGLVKEKTKTEAAIGDNVVQANTVGESIRKADEKYKEDTKAITKDVADSGGQNYIDGQGANNTFTTTMQGGQAATAGFDKSKESTIKDYSKNVESLRSQGEGLSSAKGRAELLQNMLNPKGTYQGGKASLDQMFLQKQGGQQIGEAVKDIKSKFPSLRSALDTTSTALGQGITDLSTTATDSKTAINTALSDSQANTEKDLETQASTQSDLRQKDQATLKSYLAGNIDPLTLDEPARQKLQDNLHSIGLDYGQQTFGLSPGEIINSLSLSPSVLTSEQVMDANTAAKLNALATLSGKAATYKEASASPLVTSDVSDKIKAGQQEYGKQQEAIKLKDQEFNEKFAQLYDSQVFNGNPNSTAAKNYRATKNRLNELTNQNTVVDGDGNRQVLRTPEMQQLADSIANMEEQDRATREQTLPALAQERTNTYKQSMDDLAKKYNTRLKDTNVVKQSGLKGLLKK